MSKLSEKIVVIATEDLGQKEKPNNSGFVSETKERLMKLVGWQKGDSWCAFNAESYWQQAFDLEDTDNAKLVAKYFSGNAVQTWKNFRASKEFKTDPKKPLIGSIAVWQKYANGKPTTQGHIGIVSKVLSSVSFECIEGNTSEKGSREGTIVGINRRIIGNPINPNGLNLLGFVYPDVMA